MRSNEDILHCDAGATFSDDAIRISLNRAIQPRQAPHLRLRNFFFGCGATSLSESSPPSASEKSSSSSSWYIGSSTILRIGDGDLADSLLLAFKRFFTSSGSLIFDLSSSLWSKKLKTASWCSFGICLNSTARSPAKVSTSSKVFLRIKASLNSTASNLFNGLQNIGLGTNKSCFWKKNKCPVSVINEHDTLLVPSGTWKRLVGLKTFCPLISFNKQATASNVGTSSSFNSAGRLFSKPLRWAVSQASLGTQTLISETARISNLIPIMLYSMLPFRSGGATPTASILCFLSGRSTCKIFLMLDHFTR